MQYLFIYCDRENRERRIGIDRVKDSVEKRLIEENDTILHYQQLMKELVNQVGLFDINNLLLIFHFDNY